MAEYCIFRKKEKREEYGRILAGNKGVGRFSCDRLGRFLTIYTKQKDRNYTKLFIDWEWFEINNDIDLNIQDIDLETIEISNADFENVSGFKPFKEGTILEITSLRENWNHGKILSLKRQLERLINPNQSFKSSTFIIKLLAEEFLSFEKDFEDYEKINGNVSNRIFEKLSFKVTSIQSKISRDGKHIITVLVDRGNSIFTLVEKNKFPLLKNIRVFIYYLSQYSKMYFTKQTGIRSVDFGSIFLFINGFRVPPYGDSGDDWLSIEKRKSQGYNRYLGTREIIGRIEIEDEEENFKVISSRSGVVNNDYFNQLTKSDSPYGYYWKIFRRLERFVVEGIKWDAIAVDKDINEVNNPDWDESQEVFAEDSLTRNRRILQIIKNIIDAKSEDIIRLRINENFVSDLIEEHTLRIRHEIEEIAEKLKGKNLTPHEISIFLDRIDISRDDLKSLFNIVSPYVDASLINDTDNDLEKRYNELLLEKGRIEIRLEEEEKARAKAEAERQDAERKQAEAEEEKRNAEEALEAEKRKGAFQGALIGTDKERIIGLQHQIYHSSSRISRNIKLLLQHLPDSQLDDKTKKHLSVISLEASKINAIAKFVTKANFNLQATEITTDLVAYLKEYIEEIYTSEESKIIDSEIKDITIDFEKDLKFVVEFRPLEISTLIDNFIQNSEKAKSSKLTFRLTKENKSIIFEIIDNGVGIENIRIKEIFKFGYTTTNGSGIGLHHIEDIVKRLGGTIEAFSQINQGTTFKITLYEN
ncbi:ATP-binding protein [Flavobacterium sp. 3HN19-14]|uniref:ATP-binding protein n=1 Tax=Flavobacterium sp. 3HN19-14 TaxID=3448133 RepID=UPI003EDFFC1F